MNKKIEPVNILIVDDDQDDIMLLKHYLERMHRFDARISIETNLESASTLCTRYSYDAVFLDFYWGSQNAIELLSQMPSKLKATPFVVVTSADDLDINEAVVEAGAWDFVCKNDLSTHLLEKVLLHTVQRKKHEREMHELVRQDGLTGLANRIMLEEHLKRAVSRAERYGKRVGVLAMDLDDFKQINDSLGHDAGDMLLQLMADRLKRELRQEDMIARLGGDEFIIVIEDVESREELEVVANKLLATLKIPTPIRGITSALTGSIGVTLCPDNANSPLELLRHADMALYAAKDQGKDKLIFFDEEMESQLRHRLELEADIRRALANDEFQPFFQSQVDSLTLEVKGAEVLMRWNHPKYGILSPAEFIDVAEKAGIMIDLDQSLFQRTLSQIKQSGLVERYPDFVYSFNITPDQLLDRDFPKRVRQLCEAAGLPPRNIEFEVVERALVTRAGARSIERLREEGFQVAIDDFGVGFSSLAYLRQLPVTTLKIDRSFIADMDNAANTGICQAILFLGQRLKLHTVAEGIENEAQLQAVVNQGVDRLQGFYFARPMPLEDWAITLKVSDSGSEISG